MAKKIDITNHFLVPNHTKLNDKEKKELFDKYSVTLKELPKILANDPAIGHLGLKEGDVIKIKRGSHTAGDSIFYRGVIND